MQNQKQVQFDLLVKSAQYTLRRAMMFDVHTTHKEEYLELRDGYKTDLIKELLAICNPPINIPDYAEFQELELLLGKHILNLYSLNTPDNKQLAAELNNRLLLIQQLPYDVKAAYDAKAAPANQPQINANPINRHWYVNSQPKKLELDNEWPLVDAFIADYRQQHGELQNLTSPLKIDRKNDISGSMHSFIVLPSNKAPGYIIGALARGKTETEGILGFGASGEVKALQLRDGTLMAIKIEPNSANFIKETTINNKLYNLNLEPTKLTRSRATATPWIRHKMIKDKAYGLQKIINGKSLRDYSANGHIPPTEQLQIAIAVLEAMRFYLGKGILHNDIKPENIIIRRTDEFSDKFEAEVVDFGFGEIIPNGKNYVELDTVKGTPGYLNPAIFAKPLSENFRFSIDTDLYAYSQILSKLGLSAEAHTIALELDKNYLYDDNLSATMHDDRLKYIDTRIAHYKQKLESIYQKSFGAFLGRYIEEKQAKIKRLPLGLDPATQIEYARRLFVIINKYYAKTSLIPDTATNILEILKANQDRHNKSYTAKASTLNFKTLKYLPPELRDECFARLGIQDADRREISNGTKLSQRKLLARYINNYTPAGAVGTYAADVDEKKPGKQIGVIKKETSKKRI